MRTNPAHASLFRQLCLGLLLVLLGPWASAQTPMNSAVESFLSTQLRSVRGNVSYQIAALDPRTQLAPCEAFEPFLPPGGRLWGKATLGVRCLGPSNWTIYLQVQIKVSGSYIVATRAISAGMAIASGDIEVRTGELTAFPATVATETNQVVGKTSKSGLFAGQAIRTDLLTAAWVVQQGQSVRTVANGDGFSVSSEGKALNNAQEGQIVQVRTPSGQVVSGTASAPGVVEISH